MANSLKTKWSFKQQILTLFYAFKNKSTPWYAKITALLSVIYLVSPADLVPDIIPLAGYIDDLFVVPFLVNIASKLLPPDVKRDAEIQARKKGKYILWILAIIVIAVMVLIYLLIRHIFFS